MTHDDAKRLLAPLARNADRSPVEVSAWVMRDVRALAAARPRDDGDAIVWRLAAALGSVAAVVVVGIASVALVADDVNPLVELVGVAGLEAQ